MGNFLDSPVREKETSAGADIARALWYAVASMQGWRAAMEDAHIATLTPEGFPPDTALFAVFDGHGGTLAAQLASEELVRVLAVKLDHSGAFKDGQLANPKLAADAMREAFLELDREIRRIMNKCYGKDLSGCTAVAALVTKTHIIVANAGDSRCVLAKDGTTIEMSYDHKPANPGERARIEKAGGTVRSNRVNGDLAVSRGLGDFGYKDKPELDEVEQKVSPEPDIKIHPIDGNEEFLVLACDGVWDVVTNDELCAYVRKLMWNGEKDVQKIAEELVDFCLDAGSRDNMSVILVKLNKPPKGDGPGVQPIREERKRREEAEKTAS